MLLLSLLRLLLLLVADQEPPPKMDGRLPCRGKRTTCMNRQPAGGRAENELNGRTRNVHYDDMCNSMRIVFVDT